MTGDLIASATATPAGWQNLRLKDLCVGQPAYGTNISAEAYANEGLRFIRTTDLDDRGRLSSEGVFISPTSADEQLTDGDLLLSRSGTIGRSFLYSSDEHGPCSYAGYLVRFRFRDRSAARFAFWFTKSRGFFAQIEADAVESTIANFNGQRYAALRLLIPLDCVQRDAIADFLDRETAKIDALIERTTAFAAMLEDARRARLDRAVSAGLNYDVPMRTSGVAWWPEVPAHWTIKPLKFLVKPSRYITYGIVQAGPDVADGVPYIRTSDLSGDELPLTGYLKTSHEIDFSYRRSRVSAGELVIAIRATVGKTLQVPPELDGANLTQGTARISPNSETSSEYLLHVLNSPAARSGFMSMAKGATFKEITLEMLRNFPVPVPPLAEQAAILAALNSQTTGYRRAFALVEEQRQRLLEHRSALITAVVTGQIAPVAVSASAANDNSHAFRAVVGAEIIARHGSAKAFGRVKLQKLLYLAEVHTGIHELAGNYLREAAGPLARDLLSDAERGMAAAGYYNTVMPLNEGDGYTYSRLGKAGAHRDQFGALLGGRADAVTKLIDLLKDYDTRAVEAVATLYAVWNDALLDGETPNEDRIVRGMLEEWHPEKKAKFTPADLKHWLAWMRRNGVVPTGTGSRTQLDRLFV